jgi:23S rRNA 5-hydroxycytidine C2501 synthase
MNHEKSTENIINQLSKSGDSIFRVHNVDVEIGKPVFIPTSTINKIRRNLLEELTNKRLKEYNRTISNIEKSNSQFLGTNLTYKGNVSNRLAKSFYNRHGVSSINNAFELEKPIDAELMVTRYCIKYELGICPSKQSGKQTGELYLRDNNNLYPLEFDCKNCLMKVKLSKK